MLEPVIGSNKRVTEFEKLSPSFEKGILQMTHKSSGATRDGSEDKGEKGLGERGKGIEEREKRE